MKEKKEKKVVDVKPTSPKKITIKVDGGIGRNIVSTVAVRNLKKKYPQSEINVICSCPSVFKHNPNINKIYPLNNANLYDDVIKGSHYIEGEPYTHNDYINEGKHLSEVFCKVWGVEYDDSKPEMFFRPSEIQEGNRFLIKQGKEVILFQPFGQTGVRDELYRNLDPIFAQKLVDELVKSGYAVVQVRAKNQPQLQNVVPLDVDLRAIWALIPNCKAVIGIDSMLQHASRCFDKKSIIFWGGTDEKRLGYDFHKNLRAVPLKEHYPIRLPHNAPDGYHVNLGTNNKFTDEHIKETLSYIKKL